MPLPFTVISCTSRDDSEESLFSDELIENDLNINWLSARNHTYPQSLILELDEESLVSSVTITVHPDFPPSSLTVSLGIPSNNSRNSRGKSYNADYSVRQEISFQDHFARFSKNPSATLHFHSPAKFIRISIHGFIDSPNNSYQQVAILAIVVSGAGEIAPSDQIVLHEREEMPTVREMRFVELDKGILLPLKNGREVGGEKMKAAKIGGLYESDSEDEEILFSREMLNRLRKKEMGFSKKPDLIDVDTGSEKSSQESSTKPSSSISPPLSERSTKKILEEIMGIEDINGKERKIRKEVYFGSRMAEFNNLIRILERKREESIWEERYAEAAAIDENVNDLKTREAGLKELLVEREEVLKRNDLLEAQRCKDRFDKNMSDALNLPLIRTCLTDKERKRLRLN